tara:strand:+ start:10169 stop:10597 length:429 start_codon:yes stop_codon:yes gene_type:complete
VRDVQQYIQIKDLLQQDHPGYGMVKSKHTGIFSEKELPLFLDFVALLFERFNFYLGDSGLHVLEFGTKIPMLIHNLKTICESDEPEIVFPVRKEMREIIPLIEQEFHGMGDCFTEPPMVKQFYERVASALTRSAKYHMGESQ